MRITNQTNNYIEIRKRFRLSQRTWKKRLLLSKRLWRSWNIRTKFSAEMWSALVSKDSRIWNPQNSKKTGSIFLRKSLNKDLKRRCTHLIIWTLWVISRATIFQPIRLEKRQSRPIRAIWNQSCKFQLLIISKMENLFLKWTPVCLRNR